MALTLPQNSLFSILMRSRWWVSLLVGAVVALLVRLFLPLGYALFASLPFVIISMIVLSRELKRPSAKKVAKALERARTLPAEEFLRALEEAFRRGGYQVKRTSGAPADLELTAEGRKTMVVCRRWKAQRTGIEPLRELELAAREAHGGMYVAAGEITDTARKFAAEKRIRLVEQEELARLLAGTL
jgi:restriction system protein